MDVKETSKRMEAIADYLRLVPGTEVKLAWPESRPAIWTMTVERENNKVVMQYHENGGMYIVQREEEVNMPGSEGGLVADVQSSRRMHTDAVQDILRVINP